MKISREINNKFSIIYIIYFLIYIAYIIILITELYCFEKVKYFKYVYKYK